MSVPCTQEGNIATLLAQDKALTDVLRGVQGEVEKLRESQEQQILILNKLTELSIENKHVLEHITVLTKDLKDVSSIASLNAQKIIEVENSLTAKITELSNVPAKKAYKNISSVQLAIYIGLANAIIIPVALELFELFWKH